MNLVSVITPTYNRPALLRQALASIDAQSYPDIEKIVVNDGGDKFEFFGEHKHTMYLGCKNNRGAGATRNTGLIQASGEYIAYLDDDDTYYARHIETLVTYLEAHPEKVAAYTLAHAVYRGSRVLLYKHHFDRGLLLVQNYIPNLCIMHRRSALTQCGGFDESLKTLEDWEFLIRLSLAGDFGYIPEVTAEFHVSDDQHRNSLTQASIDVYETIYKRFEKYATPEIKRAQAHVLKEMQDKLKANQ